MSIVHNYNYYDDDDDMKKKRINIKAVREII
jgi:hypothetical protein